jgi:uncharacterized protein (UPF0276 family)
VAVAAAAPAVVVADVVAAVAAVAGVVGKDTPMNGAVDEGRRTAARHAAATLCCNRAKTKIGIGWRPQLAVAIERRADLEFIEVMAEDFCESGTVPPALQNLIASGKEVIVHSTSLSLGGAELPAERQLQKMNALAERLGATIVSDHIAFVRSQAYESGHLLPVKRSQDMLEVMIENVAHAKSRLASPLVLENIATLFEWPQDEMSEAEFVCELVTATDTGLLLDISNLYANAFNHKFDAAEYLSKLPLDRLAYVHVAGGRYSNGLYHDTHSGSVPQEAIGLLRELKTRCAVPRVMVEIDDRFPDEQELNELLDRIAEAVQ